MPEVHVLRWTTPQDYTTVLQAMRARSLNTPSDAPDAIWLLEHAPVFTLGQAGDASHLLRPLADVPLVRSDRGGQITYHGPGQVILYPLLNTQRLGLDVAQLVHTLEQVVLTVLRHYQIEGHRKAGAPGVYVHDQKMASLGLRVRKGMSYHGLSMNVAMDLTPFEAINPCGHAQQEVTQLASLVPNVACATVSNELLEALCAQLGLRITHSSSKASWHEQLGSSDQTKG